MRICWSNSGDSDQATRAHALIIVSVAHVRLIDYPIHFAKAYRSDLKKYGFIFYLYQLKTSMRSENFIGMEFYESK